jgi:transcription elongation factor GreA
MLKTAIIIEDNSQADEIGLFDTVTYYVEEDDCEEQVRIVTTLRQNSMQGLISKESPLGSAILGKKLNDRVLVKVNDNYSYYIVIRKIEKGSDDASLEIRKF